MRRILTLILAVLLWHPATVLADPARRLHHYSHQAWTENHEAPAPVVALEQGRDGFLWLATGMGLFRFDGVSFEKIEVAPGDRRHVRPTALLVTRSGDVWTNFEGSGRFAVYRHGRLRLLEGATAPARIEAMAEGADGAVWALTAEHAASLLRYRDGAWRRFDARHGLPRDDALSLVVAADGTVWVALCNSIVRLRPGVDRFEVVRSTPLANPRLSQDPAGRIWVSEAGGSYPLTGPGGRGEAPEPRHPYRTDDGLIRGAPMFDRSGALWIATRYAGVERVASAQARGAPDGARARSAVEAFGAGRGLSSDVTYRMLEDREGNIWVGTETGLDKLRPAILRLEPGLTRPAAFGDKLVAASDGSVYIGQSDAIYRVRPGRDPEPIIRGVREPQSLCEGPNGELWVAFSTHVLIWSNGRTRRVEGRPEPRRIAYDCVVDPDGVFWLSLAAGGLHRYHHGRWAVVSPADGMSPAGPTTMVRGAGGEVIVQWNDRTLAAITPERQRRLPLLDFGAAAPAVVTLHPTAAGEVFAGGAFGLSRLRGDRIDTIRINEPSPDTRISGLVQTPGGDVWIAYPRALVRLTAADLERSFATGRLADPDVSVALGEGPSTRAHSHTQRSLVQGGDGRLWVATQTGTIWVDPVRIRRNSLPPMVAIRSLSADGALHRDPRALRLEAGTSDIEIDYAALSFADPRRVSVRYRLEGHDTDWQDPGARRQAFYTRLPPGEYRFRVIAANEDGVWNRTGAVVAFTIPPTFLQSAWFLVLCLVGLTLLLTLAYRLRMAQVAGRIRAGLQERLSERERIARELHDTLLQGVQGLILRFQAVSDKLTERDPARAQLESALKRADEVLAEGRDRVQELRLADDVDLIALLRRCVESAGIEPSATVRLAVEGRPRPLHPLVSTEMGRIAGEALFNIARHAGAREVQVTVRFAERFLEVEIRDDGVGIPPEVLSSGSKPGHYGLVGMRERAEKIGAAFVLEATDGAGSAVRVKVPARQAFADAVRRGGWETVLRRLRAVMG